MLGKDDEKEILDNNFYLNEADDNRNKILNAKRKKRIFILAIATGLFIIVCLFLFNSSNNVYKVNVINNKYLDEEVVIEESGINENSKFMLVYNFLVKNNLKKDPLIEDAYIEKADGNIINIFVVERKLVGYFYDGDNAYLICSDDTRILLDKDNMYLINDVPLIQGYSSEELSSIIKSFDEVDSSVINNISEIHKSSVSYDSLRLELIMEDGNFIYASSYAIPLISKYTSIETALNLEKSKTYCIVLDEVSNSGYTTKCSWEE